MNRVEQLIFLPIQMWRRGGGAEIFSIIVAITYLVLIFILIRILYRVANVACLPRIKGAARVMGVKVIAAHRELQGRYLVSVQDRYTLELSVGDKSGACDVSKHIFDSVSPGATVVVEYVVGRFDGELRVVRVELKSEVVYGGVEAGS